MTNRETTAEQRIERHRRSNTPIVFEFVDLAGDLYPITGDFILLFNKTEIPGAVAGNTLSFPLSVADKATHPQAIYPYKIRRTESGRETIPFVGNLALSNQSGRVASFELPVQQITVDNSGGIVGGITVIAGPQGIPGTPADTAAITQLTTDLTNLAGAVGDKLDTSTYTTNRAADQAVVATKIENWQVATHTAAVSFAATLDYSAFIEVLADETQSGVRALYFWNTITLQEPLLL